MGTIISFISWTRRLRDDFKHLLIICKELVISPGDTEASKKGSLPPGAQSVVSSEVDGALGPGQSTGWQKKLLKLPYRSTSYIKIIREALSFTIISCAVDPDGPTLSVGHLVTRHMANSRYPDKKGVMDNMAGEGDSTVARRKIQDTQ